jgi:spoIIIJ-associated protein
VNGPTEPTERVRALLERVVTATGLQASVTVTEDDELLTGVLNGEDLGLLIGHHGQTIDAIEHLALRIAYREADQRKRVSIDASGYRARRAAVLHRQADKAAAEALEFGRPVALDAMTAAERRLVHEYLRDHHEVETYSEGEEPSRHLVVAPVVPNS